MRSAFQQVRLGSDSSWPAWSRCPGRHRRSSGGPARRARRLRGGAHCPGAGHQRLRTGGRLLPFHGRGLRGRRARTAGTAARSPLIVLFEAVNVVYRCLGPLLTAACVVILVRWNEQVSAYLSPGGELLRLPPPGTGSDTTPWPNATASPPPYSSTTPYSTTTGNCSLPWVPRSGCAWRASGCARRSPSRWPERAQSTRASSRPPTGRPAHPPRRHADHLGAHCRHQPGHQCPPPVPRPHMTAASHQPGPRPRCTVHHRPAVTRREPRGRLGPVGTPGRPAPTHPPLPSVPRPAPVLEIPPCLRHCPHPPLGTRPRPAPAGYRRYTAGGKLRLARNDALPLRTLATERATMESLQERWTRFLATLGADWTAASPIPLPFGLAEWMNAQVREAKELHSSLFVHEVHHDEELHAVRPLPLPARHRPLRPGQRKRP